MKLFKVKILLGFFIFTLCANAQDESPKKKQINIVHGANFTKDETNFPGASIFSKDTQQVQFEHEGANLWCDIAIFYQKENRLEGRGNIRLQQGDSVQMVSGRIDYNGNTKLAKAFKDVTLTNISMTLKTDTLHLDRSKQEAYYDSFGTIVDSVNTITSNKGRYYITPKKYQLLDSVNIQNPDYNLVSERLDYYTTSKNAYMYGPSTITGEDYIMYCERGFYDSKIERGYGIKNTRIDYNNRIIIGDSLFFDKATEFASATNNIKITDTVNNSVIRAHYAEVFKAKDSVFATKRAVSISLVEKDSLYMHGDIIMATGKPEERIVRAFKDARFYKTDLSGKCDSIHFEQKTGVTQLITNPIIWNGENQMTGDSIHLLSNLETEQLDSLKVIENSFIISLDSIGKTGYNQAKGKNLFGKFVENELRIVDLVQNAEVIYYAYNDKNEFIGINYTICSKINIEMANNDIEDLTFFVDPDGTIHPDGKKPEKGDKLEGFTWHGKERIKTMEEIFDEKDNTIVLPIIRGINNPIDIDAEELERQQKEKDAPPTPTLTRPKATKPKKNTIPKTLSTPKKVK